MHIPNVCEGHGCAEIIESVNVESWEVSGKFLCADCADADFDRRSEDGAEPDKQSED
jgi:hypothetical protein